LASRDVEIDRRTGRIVAALIGTAIARALGIADTRGFDWIELIVQVVLAAIGVVIAANLYARRGIRH
jgi:hypothetical protein